MTDLIASSLAVTKLSKDVNGHVHTYIESETSQERLIDPISDEIIPLGLKSVVILVYI